jgi:hypothetical protein
LNFILGAVLAATLTAASPVEQAFAEGETLDYQLVWLRMTGGTARMTIAPLNGERPALRITSIGRSSPGFSRIYKVRDEIESIVARKDFSTLRYSKKLDEKNQKREEVTVIEGEVATRTRSRRTEQKIDVPRPIMDPISVIYHLRTLDLSEGNAHRLTLIADGKIYQVNARVVRRETIQTPAGRFATVVVEPEMISGGEAREERLFIWFSDDERRIPVRIRSEIRVGAITATLSGVSRGVTSIEPPSLRR